jgi:hypothetical protein
VAPTAHALPRTANERLKDGARSLLAISLLAATLTHLLVFALWPPLSMRAIGVGDRPDVASPAPRADSVPPPPRVFFRNAEPVAGI